MLRKAKHLARAATVSAGGRPHGALGWHTFSTAAPRIKTYAMSSTTVAVQKPGSFTTTDTGHQISTDLPRLSGGDDTAPQPVELMTAALLGCKVATAHFVARHAWPRKHNRITSIRFTDVVAERDEQGALAMPITADPPVSAALLRVRGVAHVRPASETITAADVATLGHLVEVRCPVAATLTKAGCALDFEWIVDT